MTRKETITDARKAFDIWADADNNAEWDMSMWRDMAVDMVDKYFEALLTTAEEAYGISTTRTD